jgi:hypothetical protein
MTGGLAAGIILSTCPLRIKIDALLLETQTITHDSILAEETLQQLQRPRMVDGQRVSALRFADPIVQALWNAVLM